MTHQMPDVCLSMLVATSGRRTLDDTLASITAQIESGDEILVYFDTSGDAGDTARNRMMPQACGTHLVFVDDDDVLLPGALRWIRRFARENPGRIGIFRLNYGVEGPRSWSTEGDLWNTQTGMYVVPNVPGKVGRWGSPPDAPAGRQGDYTFICETVALQGEPVWCEEAIQDVRPERSRLRRLRYRLSLRTRMRSLFFDGSLRRRAFAGQPPAAARRSTDDRFADRSRHGAPEKG
jgi:hypothetical protein